MKNLLYILLFVPLALFGQEEDIITQLNQSFDAWNVSIDLEAGWNMFGYGCPNSIDVIEGLSNHTESIIVVKDNNGAAYLTEWDFNGIGYFTPGFGYQIKVGEAIGGFSLCDWYVNDIPEDNIVSLQEEVESLQLENQIFSDSIAVLNSDPLIQVGDLIENGIVFYIDETGHNGLVAAQEDLEGFYDWGCFNEYVDGADSEWIGSGLSNTIDITNQGCQAYNGGVTSAQAAIDTEIYGHSDWYLPSQGELYQMYITIGQGSENGNIGGFSNDWYWSSSESNNTLAWYVSFANGDAHGNYKASTGRVRVIRAF